MSIPWIRIQPAAAAASPVTSIPLLVEGFSQANQVSYTTGSFTPTANRTILAVFGGAETTGPMSTKSLADTGNGLTWTLLKQVRFRGDPTHSRDLSCWWAVAPASPNSMTLTITNNQDSGTPGETDIGMSWHVMEFVGGASGASLFLNDWNTEDDSPGGTNNSGTQWVSTATAFSGDSDSRVLMATTHAAAETITPEWSLVGTVQTHNLPDSGQAVSANVSSYDNTLSHTWTTSSAYGGIAFELAAG